MSARADDLESAFRQRRSAKTATEEALSTMEAAYKAVEREARESLAKAESIENAVYDLKAVNPNRVSDEDTRTPGELLDFIAGKGREADAALARLRALVPPGQGQRPAS